MKPFVPVPLCYMCKHYQEGERGRCASFPEGIPYQILSSLHDHRSRYGVDDDVFEPVSKAAADYANFVFTHKEYILASLRRTRHQPPLVDGEAPSPPPPSPPAPPSDSAPPPPSA